MNRNLVAARSRRAIALALSIVVVALTTPARAGSATMDKKILKLPVSPIELYPTPTAQGRMLSEEMSTLAANPSLILLQAANFDPIVQGQPDFSGSFPTRQDYLDGLSASRSNTIPLAYIVQFSGVVTEQMKQALRDNGATPYFYLPNNAYLVRMLPTKVVPVRQIQGVRWVGRFLPGYKIAKQLARFALKLDAADLTDWLLPDGRPKPLYLTLFPGADLAVIGDRLEKAGLHVLYLASDPEQPLIVVQPPTDRLAGVLDEAAHLEDVISIYRHDPMSTRNNNADWIHQSYDTAAKQVYATSARIWNHGLQGDGEVAVIADSGVDRDMCFFRTSAGAALVATQTVSPDGLDAGPLTVDATQRKIIAYNVVVTYGNTPTATDDSGAAFHGTHMAGSMLGDNFAALANETTSLAGAHHNTADGMAPAAKLIVQDVGVPLSSGIAPPPIVDTMWQQAYNAGARISSNSWGGGPNSYNATAQFADRMTYKNENFLVVLPAGNQGVAAATAGSLESQSNSKNALVAGASSNSVNAPFGNDRGTFSGVGKAGDGRIKPDVMTSGVAVVSALGTASSADANCATQPFDGTSSSTAVASGTAILAREYYVKGMYPSGVKTPADAFDPSAALVKATLINGARNMDGANIPAAANSDAPSGVQGWGRVTLDDALWFSDEVAAADRKLAAWDVRHNSGLATGDVWESEVYVNGTTTPLKITLAWSDAPASLGAAVQLVNDLNLEVAAPDGRVYHGNQWYAEDASKSTIEDSLENVTAYDNLNNVEGVFLETDAQGTFPAGLYRIRVRGGNVPGSPVFGEHRQGFAVVATGDVNRNAGRVTITNRTIGCEGAVNVTLYDPNSTGNVTITTSGGDSETVTMAGASPNFSGSISAFWNEAVLPNDGRLQVIQEESITATYNDSNPAGHVSMSPANIHCAPTVAYVSHAISGGCDADGFLDEGEFDDMVVTIKNTGSQALTGVTVRLVSQTSGVFVTLPDSLSFPDIPAGGTGTNATPFKVSAHGVTALQTGNFRMEISAAGRTGRPMTLDFQTTLEADKIVTNGDVLENFSTVAVKCNTDPTLNTTTDWFYFVYDGTCNTALAHWDATTGCDGATNREIMFPRKTAATCTTTDGTDTPSIPHIIRSRVMSTGVAGSKTTLNKIRLLQRYNFATFDGQCDFGFGAVLRLSDGSLLLYNLIHSKTKSKTDAVVDEFDLTEAPDFSVGDPGNLLSVLMEFRLQLDGALTGTTTCPVVNSGGELANWRIDDVELLYTNVNIVADATTCPNACAGPPPPAAPAASAAATGSNQVTVFWNAVSGADHYDVYRGDPGCGANMTRVGRVYAPPTGFVDNVASIAAAGYLVRAVNANGLCESVDSACVDVTPTGACRAAPSAPQAVAVDNASLAACQLNLSWGAPASNACGNALNYRIYRSTDPVFVPLPGNLLTTVASTSYADPEIASGFDANGEPVGSQYYYVVRALDPVTGVEDQNAIRVTGRAGGPRAPGTWFDDAGDTRPLKMTSVVGCDFGNTAPGWSVSSLEDGDGSTIDGSSHSYRSVKSGDSRGSTSNPLTCVALVSSKIRLLAGTPSLIFFQRFNIEWQWDGVVVETSVDGGLTWQLLACPYPDTLAQTVSGGCDTTGDGTGDCPFPPGGPFDCDGDGIGSCDGEGDTWINSCDYSTTQAAFTGPNGNAALTAWTQTTCSLTALAGQTVQFRFNQSTDCGADFEGMYVDRLQVTGAELDSACTSSACATPPTFPGLVSARDLSPSLDTGVQLTWPAVSVWGGGGSGSFEVYRGGSAIATAIAAGTTTFTDNAGLNNLNYSYRVVAKTGGACNVRDGNDIDITAADCVDPLSGDVGVAILTLAKKANVELMSTTVPNAMEYRFYYSSTPANVFGPNTFITSAGPRGSHNTLADGIDRYYLLKVSDGGICGNTVVP